MREILLGCVMLLFITGSSAAKTPAEAMVQCKIKYLRSNDKTRFQNKNLLFEYCMRSQRFYRYPASPSAWCGGDNAFCYTSSPPPPPPPRSLLDKAKGFL